MNDIARCSPQTGCLGIVHRCVIDDRDPLHGNGNLFAHGLKDLDQNTVEDDLACVVAQIEDPRRPGEVGRELPKVGTRKRKAECFEERPVEVNSIVDPKVDDIAGNSSPHTAF